MKKSISTVFKNDLIKARALCLNPMALMVLCEMALYAWEKNLRFSVTETVTTTQEDKALNRVSTSHAEGRAFDVSTRQWEEKSVVEFMNTFTKKYSHLGAIGKSGNAALIVRHDAGRGDHFHVQFNKEKFAVADISLGGLT